MKKIIAFLFALVCVTVVVFSVSTRATSTNDPLPSWNEGAAKKAILDFVQTTTDKSSANYLPPEERFATFDQDGTLWVEQPIYTQVIFALNRVVSLAPQHPEWKNQEPFKSVITKNKLAYAYGPLSKVGTFSNALMAEATHRGWQVISMKNDWKRIFPFEK